MRTQVIKYRTTIVNKYYQNGDTIITTIPKRRPMFPIYVL